MAAFLIDLLENAGLLVGTAVSLPRIRQLGTEEILEFVEQAAELASAAELPRSHSIFDFSASISIGAGRACHDLMCRLARAEELARFAAFYSDKVYIYNFLSDLREFAHPELAPRLRYELFVDLAILARLRPLIEAGRIQLVSGRGVHCLNCLTLDVLGVKGSKRFRRAFQAVSNELYQSGSVEFYKHDDHYHLDIQCPEELAGHGANSLRMSAPPVGLAAMPRIMRRVESGETVALSRTLQRKLFAFDWKADSLFRDVVYNMVCAQSTGSTFLSDLEIHRQILSTLTDDGDLVHRNQLVSKYLTTIVPFAPEVDVTDLLKLRDREGDAFIVFRAALNRAIDEYRSQKQRFTEHDARTLYCDVIAPDLAKLNQKVRGAKRGLRRSVTGVAAGATAEISFGMYSGLLPSVLLGAAKAIGLTKVVSQLADLLAGSDLDSPISGEDMFFLWKARELPRSDQNSAAVTIVPDHVVSDRLKAGEKFALISDDEMWGGVIW